MDEVLRAALDGIDTEIVEDMEILEQDPFKYRGRRLLFAVPLGRNGINRGYYEVLAWLRGGDQVLAGATAGMIIDAESEFYTKATARELAVAANRAGCAFVGRPLVEGTASLDNYLIRLPIRTPIGSALIKRALRSWHIKFWKKHGSRKKNRTFWSFTPQTTGPPIPWRFGRK